MDKEKLTIDYGFVSPTLEEQLNKYGFTLGEKAEEYFFIAPGTLTYNYKIKEQE